VGPFDAVFYILHSTPLESADLAWPAKEIVNYFFPSCLLISSDFSFSYSYLIFSDRLAFVGYSG
jgi:hypothetical protein